MSDEIVWTDERVRKFAEAIRLLLAISEPPEGLEITSVIQEARARATPEQGDSR